MVYDLNLGKKSMSAYIEKKEKQKLAIAASRDNHYKCVWWDSSRL